MRPILAAVVIGLAPFAALCGQDEEIAAEARLRSVFESIRQGRAKEALDEADRLVSRHPNFRLAHLVRADLLLARAGPIERFGNTGHAGRERLEGLRKEAWARLRADEERPPPGELPRHILRMSPMQKHAILVDASRFRAYVYENAQGVPRLVEDYYTTLGKNGIDKLREGDGKTPLGVYHVTSMIAGAKLPDLYGWGALPINYPNEWDRLAGRTGHGIWLHGVPSETYARPPSASDGCIALANTEIERLARRVQAGLTPVIIAERIDWLPADRWRAESESFLGQLEAWRTDWERRDTDRYLSHYARTFRSEGMDLAGWAAHKRRVSAAKGRIEVSLADVSVFRNPGTPDLIVVTFAQHYRSARLSRRSLKRQYWVVEDGRWKIAYEAPVARPVVAMPESFGSARRRNAAAHSVTRGAPRTTGG